MPRKHRLLWSVCIGHLTNDVFTSMVPVLLTFLAAGMLPMSNAQIGLAVSLSQLFGAFTQPFFGILADPQWGTLDWFAWPRVPRLYVHALDPDGGLHAAILADVRSAGDRHHRQRRFASGRRIARGRIRSAPLDLQYGDLLLDGANRSGARSRHCRYLAGPGESPIYWAGWVKRSA